MGKVISLEYLKFLVGMLAISVSSFTVDASGRGKAGSDYQFDPDTLRPAVLADAKERIDVWMPGSTGSYSPVIGDLDIRLVDGEIPVYDLDGNVVAYLFMIYLKPGPLPTLKEIRESTASFAQIIKNRGPSDFEDPFAFFAREYPFMNNCAWAIYGANKRFPSWITGWHVPNIFLQEPEAKTIAKSYNAGRDVEEPKIVVFGPAGLALQFEIGDDPLIVYVDRGGPIDKSVANTKAAFLESKFYKSSEFIYTNEDIYYYYLYIMNRDSDGELRG
jgi:hypothetical protein